jgi:hypothetical protein
MTLFSRSEGPVSRVSGKNKSTDHLVAIKWFGPAEDDTAVEKRGTRESISNLIGKLLTWQMFCSHQVVRSCRVRHRIREARDTYVVFQYNRRLTRLIVL